MRQTPSGAEHNVSDDDDDDDDDGDFDFRLLWPQTFVQTCSSLFD